MTAPNVFQLRIALVHDGYDGYAIVDEDGPIDAYRYRTWTAAAARLTQMESEEAEAERQSRADYIDDHE